MREVAGHSAAADADNMDWDETLQEITRQWSLPFLFPHQQLCVHYLLSAAGYFGPDSEHNPGLLVSLPTGSGKSLCFMAPAALLDGITIIFYPLNALLRDQKRRFESAGVSTLLYYGGLEKEERRDALDVLENMERGVILTNIESAGSEAFQRRVRREAVRFIVIDEGHLILQWGKSFRPGLLSVSDICKMFEGAVMGVFTATISETDRIELGGMLWPDGRWDYFELLSDRTNISYRMIPCVDEVTALRLLLRQALCEKFDLFTEAPRLRRELRCPMLVFMSRREDCEAIARQAEIWLRLWGRRDIVTWYYHAGLSSEERKKIENDFAACSTGLLFTTKAFGTGVDISGIRSTIHFREPETMEDFLQESGRAGRDSEPAYSYVLQKEARLFTGEGCLRRQALAALGQEAPICSGCSYCEGIEWQEPVERAAIKGLRRLNRVKLNPDEEYHLLRYVDFASMKKKTYLDIEK